MPFNSAGALPMMFIAPAADVKVAFAANALRRCRGGLARMRKLCMLCGSLWLTGCVASTGLATTPTGISPAPSAPNSVLDFVSKATVGQSTTLPNGDSAHGAINVTVVNAYYAASGRNCRQYTVTDSGHASQIHIACSGSQGWSEVRPLVAADAVGPSTTAQ